MNTEGIGTPIYRMNEIHNGMCDTNVTKYAVMPGDELAKFLLNDRDVLFNRTNSDEFVGRTGIYYNTDNVQKTFASYLVRFVPDEDMVTNEYFACFLNTKYAKAEIKRRSRPSVNQTNVNPEEVKGIKIPLLSRQLQSKIKLFFTEANRYRMIAEKLYNQAESILNTELQAPDFENSKNYSVKTMSNSFCLSGRLDAEYYQPKYDYLYRLLDNLPTERLEDIADIKKSIEPGSEFYCDDGIPFIRVSDVNIFGLENPAVKLSEKKLSKKICSNYESLYPKKDTILFSKDGSAGIAYKIDEDTEAITSGALLHLRVKNTGLVLPDYLTLVLNSVVVQMQAERDIGGSVIKHWLPDDIENVVIPVLPYDIQLEITMKVQESFSLRKKSKACINKAVKAVEMAIEQDEDTAIRYLKEV